uniref:Ig-like domain-containing protein n=1 Tax=Sphaeramia orbicularis TaxID=375764 RepID=A0A672YFB8_9TELE
MDLRLGVCILIGDCCVFSVSNGAVVTLDPNWSEIYTGEKITLRCEIHRGDTEWEYEWRKSDSALSETESEIRITKAHSDHTGDYSCRGKMKQSQDHSTNWSNNVTLTVTVGKIQVVLTLDPNWSEIFYGEAFTLRCEIQDGGNTGWTYEWTLDTINLTTTTNEYRITRATPAHRGSYRCRGRTDSSVTTVWSNVIKLTVAGKMKHLLFIRLFITVTLTCSVSSSLSGWKYYWKKDNTDYYRQTTYSQLTASSGGTYQCRGGKGDPVHYSDYSNSVGKNKAHCLISNATTAHRGSYRCRGRTDSSDTTQWSNVIELTVAGKMKHLLFIRLFITL